MIRKLIAVAALTVAPLAAASTAYATPTVPAQVKIYLENNVENHGTVTADCGRSGTLLHTALFNDAIGANVVETAEIFREDTGAKVFGPVDVPIGGNVPVAMPYLPGVTFDAVAIPKGATWPATTADLVVRLSAHPPTADNSQLFPLGYPSAPADCPVPTPSPCPTPTVRAGAANDGPTCQPTGTPTPTSTCPTGERDDRVTPPCGTCPTGRDDAVQDHPTCPPSSPSQTPTGGTTPTVTASVTASATGTPTASTGPTTAATDTSTSAALVAATTPAGPVLAHTGANVLLPAALAVMIAALGGAFVLFARKKRAGAHR